MSIRIVYSIIILLLAAVGCSSTHEGGFKLPGVYRVDVQQGNVLEQEMIDKLKPGMDKNQVRFIMGTPALIDPFHVDRWEYIYTFSKGGGRRQQLHITVYFEDDILAYLDGDVVSALRRTPDTQQKSKTVDVPIDQHKKPGLFRKMLNVLPFVGDDKPAPAEPESTEQTEAEAATPMENKENN